MTMGWVTNTVKTSFQLKHLKRWLISIVKESNNKLTTTATATTKTLLASINVHSLRAIFSIIISQIMKTIMFQTRIL
jgi:hypothetical protein